ncbi:MAG: hypothetical protein LBQ94_11260 [Treponema sp.]|nr:hypothetical protein [Treponema sp.]
MTTNVFNHLLSFSIIKTIITRMEDYEKKEAAIKLMAELEKGRISGEKEGWQTLEEVRKEFGLTNA